MEKVAALVVAAGRGHRFGGGVPKQYRSLDGRAVLRHSLAAFAAHSAVSVVRAVIHPDDAQLYEAAAEGLSLAQPAHGGATRQDSVRLGLESLVDEAPDLVLIHDGARPFVPAPLIDRVLAALGQHAGAIPALPVVDTLKRSWAGVVGETVDREGLYRAQTPQGFRFAEILAAHRAATGRALTDDAAVAEAAGLTVALVDGSEENVKITGSDDLARAERRMAGPELRIGSGFDVHRLTPGDGVRLCGITIPAELALEGHSDADVALHAVTDALLGAIGAGDIGSHFPPSDPQWRGAASARFVRHAMALIENAGGTVVNLDLTVIGERPRIGPHRGEMRASLAEMLGIAPHRIGIKATTTEGLGFTGRGEGIAAQASVLVRLAG